jgi:phosphoribosylamine-glycine ligase
MAEFEGLGLLTVRVLVIGSGAREHALLLALRRDPEVDALAVAPGNAGTASIAEQYDVDITAGDEVVKLAKRFEADLVVVGPEVPLVLGVADAVRAVQGRRPHRGREVLRQGRDGRRGRAHRPG